MIRIFWVCRLSPAWHIYRSQFMSRFVYYQLQLVYPTVEHHPVRNLQHKNLQTTFDTFDQSQHLLHTLQQIFYCVSVFTFLEITKHMPKMLHYFLPSSILKWLQKNSPILFFKKTHADVTAVTIQSNKTVLKKVKDN